MKIKKIISLILLSFITLATCSPSVSAVTISGNSFMVTGDYFDAPRRYKTSTSLNLPGIATTDGTTVANFTNPRNANGYSSFYCAVGWNEEDKSCTTYLATLTPFFVFSTENFIDERVIYSVTGTKKIEIHQYKEVVDDITYIRYDLLTTGEHAQRFNLGRIRLVDGWWFWQHDTKVWVVGINIYLYVSSVAGVEGIYYGTSSFFLYNDNDNDVVLAKAYGDEVDEWAQRWFWWSLRHYFAATKWAYGALLYTLADQEVLYQEDRDWGKKKILQYETKVIGSNKFYLKEWTDSELNTNNHNNFFLNSPQRLLDSRSNWTGQQYFDLFVWINDPTNGIRVRTLFMNSIDDQFYDLWDNKWVSNDVLIMDYFLWRQSKDVPLIANLKDYFWASDVKADLIVDGSANPDNWTDWQNCEATDIGCHIKSLWTSIVNGFGSVFKWIFDFFGSFFENLFEFFKILLFYIWDGIKIIFSSIFSPFVAFYEFISSSVNLFVSHFWSFIMDKWYYEDVVCDIHYNYTLTDDEWIRAMEEYKKFEDKYFDISYMVGFSDNILTFIKFINPIPPPDFTKVCTFSGMKEIHYNQNTFIDIILVMTFSFATILLFFRRSE